MDPGYKKTITPVPEFGNRNLMVNVSLRILDILRIDEMKKTFTVKISLTREWMDRRLTYKNLKKESSNKNDLSKLEAESIWYPLLDINNIENMDKIREGSRYQIWLVFGKVPKVGRGVIFNPKIYVADFGNFKQGFLNMKLIQNSNFRVRGMFFNNCI